MRGTLTFAGIVAAMGGAALFWLTAKPEPSSTDTELRKSDARESSRPSVEEFSSAVTGGPSRQQPKVTQDRLMEPGQDETLLIIAGKLTREEFDGDYDSIIRGVARTRIAENVRVAKDERVAAFCGFDSWEVLEELLISNDSAAVAIRTELEEMVALATHATDSLAEQVDLAWERNDCVQVVDFSIGDNGAKWLEQHNYVASPGLLVFESTTKVGDRGFRLHFDSSRFPVLESELELLSLHKKKLWELMAAQK